MENECFKQGHVVNEGYRWGWNSETMSRFCVVFLTTFWTAYLMKLWRLAVQTICDWDTWTKIVYLKTDIKVIADV